MTTAQYQLCTTCGHSLEMPAGHVGVYATVRDNVGIHHVSCWSRPVIDERAWLERAAALEKKIDILGFKVDALTTQLQSHGIEPVVS